MFVTQRSAEVVRLQEPDEWEAHLRDIAGGPLVAVEDLDVRPEDWWTAWSDGTVATAAETAAGYDTVREPDSDPFPSGAELGHAAVTSLDPRPLDLVSGERPASAVAGAAAERLGATSGSALAAAVGRVREAVAELAAIDLGGEAVGVVGDAALTVQAARTALDTTMIGLLGTFDERDGHRADGAASAATWLSQRSNLTFAAARDLAVAARRLEDLPLLAGHLDAGDVALEPVLMVSRKMCSAARVELYADREAEVAELVLGCSSLSALRHHLEMLADQADPEPAAPGDPGHEVGRHPDRRLHQSRSFDGLGVLDATLDPYTRELLEQALEAFATHDGSGVPVEQRRTAAQRRHDAFSAILDAALASSSAGTVQGARPHVGIIIDLAELLGIDPDHPMARLTIGQLADLLGITLHHDPDLSDRPFEDLLGCNTGADPDGVADAEASDADADAGGAEAGDADADAGGAAAGGDAAGGDADADAAADAAGDRPAVASRGGLGGPAHYMSGVPIPAAHVRQLIASATIYAVLTLGPWRPIDVGPMRTLPAWLRAVLTGMHQRCRGPGCQRPALWTEAAHGIPYRESRTTRLDDTLPLCGYHHKLSDQHGWDAELDDATGIVTWTSPDGRIYHDHPGP